MKIKHYAVFVKWERFDRVTVACWSRRESQAIDVLETDCFDAYRAEVVELRDGSQDTIEDVLEDLEELWN